MKQRLDYTKRQMGVNMNIKHDTIYCKYMSIRTINRLHKVAEGHRDTQATEAKECTLLP